MPEEYHVALIVASRPDVPTNVCIEPWAEEITVPAGKTLRVVITGSEQGEVTLEHYEDQLLIWGFSGSRADAYLEGNLIWQCHQALTDLGEQRRTRLDS